MGDDQRAPAPEEARAGGQDPAVRRDKLQDLLTASKIRRIFEGVPHGEFLASLTLLTRSYDWVDKLWLMTGAALVLLIDRSAGHFELVVLSAFFFYQILALSYAYSLNAWTDREEDSLAGKDRGASGLAPWKVKATICLLGAGTLAIPLSFLRLDIGVLGVLNVFLATFYSARPLRFKERGPFAFLVSGVGQRSLGLLFLILLIGPDPVLSAILFAWIGVIGTLTEISHQVLDSVFDSESRSHTWGAKVSALGARRSVKFLLLSVLGLALSPLPLFPGFRGLAYASVIFTFSTYPIHYSLDALQSLKDPSVESRPGG